MLTERTHRIVAPGLFEERLWRDGRLVEVAVWSIRYRVKIHDLPVEN